MSYDELNNYVNSFGAPEWVNMTNREICLLLGLKDLTENNETIKFCYYKSPFTKDNKEDSEKQVIIFTKLNLIIIGAPEFESNGRIKNVELKTIRMKDIQKMILKAPAYDPDINIILEIIIKDGSIIRLNSNDANKEWIHNYVERIREIGQYLLHTI